MSHSTTEIARLCDASTERSRRKRSEPPAWRAQAREDAKALGVALAVLVGLTLLALALYALGAR